MSYSRSLSFILFFIFIPAGYSLEEEKVIREEQGLKVRGGEPIVQTIFTGKPALIVTNSNPDEQKGFTDLKTKNPIGFFVDVGGYGAPSFSGLSIPEAITGALNIPESATLTNHGAGVSGYARSASPSMGAVGLYGQGDAIGANTTAWGFNTRTIDNGVKTNGLWGGEIDVSVTVTGNFVRGLDIVGGSTAQPDVASPGIIVQTPGIGFKGKATPFFWGRAVLLDDESAYTGIEVGTARVHPSVGSMPVTFMHRDAKNERGEAFRIYSNGPNGIIEVSSRNALLRFRGDIEGSKQDNLTIHGANTGIGAGAQKLPAYPLDVYGAARFTGPVGFGGVKPVSRPKLPPPAKDIKTTIILVNAIRSALIENGLAE